MPCHVKLYFVSWSVDNQEMPNPQCEIIMIGQLLSPNVLLEDLWLVMPIQLSHSIVPAELNQLNRPQKPSSRTKMN